jgi:hypothetical protein
MGFFDALLLIVEVSIPVLLAVMAVLDWRRARRGRYLILGALYAFFGLVLVVDFFSTTSGGPFVCASVVVWLLVLGIFHNRFRRGDRTHPRGTSSPSS